MKKIGEKMFNNFYSGKRVFLTGHTGFKGSWLALWLNKLGAEVKGYALKPRTKNDHFVVAGIEKKVSSVLGDIRDYEKLRKEINDFKPEIVFHLAAQPLVRQSYLSPRETFEVNVIGTVNILDALRECDALLSFINVTSDKCYENLEKNEGYKENDPMGGYDPYSSSKGCSELVTASYRRSFYNRAPDEHPVLVASARAGNVIGGGDWCQDRILPDTISALMHNRIVEVRNPDAVRPWQHVLEPLSGYLWLASQVQQKDFTVFSGGWNFGPEPGSFVKVSEIVDMAIAGWGSGSWKDVSDSNLPHETALLVLDCEKANKDLSWRPVMDAKQSVALTVAWYKEFYTAAKTGGKVNCSSFNQIDEYFGKARSRGLAWVS
jgi:CDP-glucose 4,6-dehydratase